MPTAVSRTLAVISGCSLLLLGTLAAPAQAAKSTKTVNATATLTSLVKQTRALPRGAASSRAKANLLRNANRARAARRSPCSALSRLAAYRKTLRATKIRNNPRLSKSAKARLRARLAALGPASLKASRKLLSDRRTKSCGGGVIPSTRKSAAATVMSSDANGMRLRVSMPQLQFAPQNGGGKNWTQLVLPNTDTLGNDGKPGIPVVSQQFGVPNGATLTVVPGTTESYKIEGVEVFPTQPEALDDNPIPGPPGGDPNNPLKPNFDAGQFKQPAFTIDNSAYKTDGFVPAAPASGQILGEARDVVIGGLSDPGGAVRRR